MSEREDIKTIRHFVYKAGKWNDSAEEYANDTGVYDALDRIETALAASDAGAVTDEMVMAAHRAMGEGWCYCYYGNPVDHRTGKLVPVLDAMLRKGLTAALGGNDANG